MTFWTLIALFLVINGTALLWVAVVLRAYYCGSKQIDPVPRVEAPLLAGLFRRNGATAEPGEDRVPLSMRKA